MAAAVPLRLPLRCALMSHNAIVHYVLSMRVIISPAGVQGCAQSHLWVANYIYSLTLALQMVWLAICFLTHNAGSDLKRGHY